MADSVSSTYVLAIDLGSGGPKVALFSDRGELIGYTARTIQTFFTGDGGGEQDPEQWWQSVTEAVRELMDRRLVPVERVAAVSCASQWSVTVPVDRQGRHLMNAVHWSDSRGAVHTARLTDGLIKVSGYEVRRLWRWMRMTGGAPTDSGADALAHMLFIKHDRPDVYRQTYKLLEPMDYLNLRLCGRAAASYATIYPYLLTDNRDNTRVVYDDRLIGWSGLDRDKLPELLPVGSVLGTIRPEAAAEWGLSADTQIISGTPDSQAAALGSGAVDDYAGHVCVGTTAWLSCHVPFKKTNIFDFVATMPSAVHGRNMVVAEQGPAGKCLTTFVDNWLYAADGLVPHAAPADIYLRIEQLVASIPPGSDDLLFLPWINGAGPPSGDGRMRGGFLNQSIRTTRAQALRAIMEGVGFNLLWLRKSVERFVGREFPSLNFIGGCARSDTWCQILADVLDRPIHRVVDPQMAIARGAALAALVGLGRMSTDQIGSVVRVEKTFLPRSEHRQTYAKLFNAFLSSYKATRPIFHRLHPRGQRQAPPATKDSPSY